MVFQTQQILPGPLEQQAALQVAPTGLYFLATDSPVQQSHQRDGDRSPDPVDQEHDGQAPDRSQQRRRPVADNEIAAGNWGSS